jgi:hypothetical protein
VHVDALERNLERLQCFADETGALLCPHIKTSMSPELFRRQLAHGYWGLSVATCHQLQVARREGARRVLYANQLIGAADVRYVCDELRRDRSFEYPHACPVRHDGCGVQDCPCADAHVVAKRRGLGQDRTSRHVAVAAELTAGQNAQWRHQI